METEGLTESKPRICGKKMTEVKIPFREEFRMALLASVKTMTTRTRMMGRPGDTFTIFGRTFQLTSVDKFLLGDICSLYWKEEGVDSPASFAKVWREIHPRKGYDPKQSVWGHRFRILGENRK